MRNFPDWLSAFLDYASYGEAPKHMYFWTGVSTLAGVLRRRVWIDQAYFVWYPNFYVVLVAPPGIVSKSTTANVGMNLLRQIPGVRFGPDVVTSQALITAFAESAETFEYDGAFYPMSALTLASSEFGNLLNPQDKMMVDLMVELWDGNRQLEKKTKMSGNDLINAPWINLIACTTPSWIADNFPEYMIGGGLVSRMIFVYAEKKAKYVAYPGLAVPGGHKEMGLKLIQDLEHIAVNLCGPYTLAKDTIAWGESWYKHHYENRPKGLEDDRFGGYIARKQTHIHKLAMVLAASRSDSMVIDVVDLATANEMVTALELDMPRVFQRIGVSEQSVQAERFLAYVHKRGKVPYEEAYRFIHAHFPGFKEFEDMLMGCIRSGQISLRNYGSKIYLVDETDPPGTVAEQKAG